MHSYDPMSMSRPTAPTNSGLQEMLSRVEMLQRERDQYANDAYLEKQKNLELEKEFHVLRGLIQEAQKPVGQEENMMLRNQYGHERDLRIQSENDAKMIRQQLADTLSEIHRDTTNLKKAISDM